MYLNKWKIGKDPSGKFKIDQIRIPLSEDEVIWTSEEGEFRIWFPPEMNPLAPGDDVSKGGELRRQLRKRIRRGATETGGDRYYYSIYLIDRDMMVECKSSPEMIVE